MGKHKEYFVTGEPKLSPFHPGEMLKEEILPALGLSVTAAAKKLRVSRQTLHRILSGTHGITPEMAMRIGKFCGNGPRLWLALQQDYDLWKLQKRFKAELRLIPTQTEKPQRRKKSA